MADERKKPDELATQSHSSSDSSPPEPSLEHVFGAMARALGGLTTAIEGNTKSDADLKAGLAALVSSHAELIKALASSPKGATGSLDAVAAMVARAERAVEDSKKFLTEKKESPEDEITGEHIKLRWKTIGQGLVYTAPIAFKILGVLAASAVTAWGIVKNLFPFIKGLH